MKLLYLIIARGGSKGIPNKNLKKIKGISLIEFKAISAMRSKYCSKLIISTDSLKIKNAARMIGVDVPFNRPIELAQDDSLSGDVVRHAITFFESELNEKYDAIMLLEPSSPFATHLDYDKAVEMMIRKKAKAIVGVREAKICSSKHGRLDNKLRIWRNIDNMKNWHSRRQDDKKEYILNGAFYLTIWDFFKQHKFIMEDPKHTYAYIMDQAYSVHIDDWIDLQWARYLVEKRYVDIRYWKERNNRIIM